MPPAFFAAARGNHLQTATDNTVTTVIPASVTDGMVGVYFVDSSSNPTLNSITSGWTTRSGPDGGATNVYRGFCFTKTLTAAEAGTNVTATLSFGARDVGILLVFSGVTESGIVVGTPVLNETATTAPALPTLTAPAGAMLVAGFMRRYATTFSAITVPSPYTSPVNGDANTNYASGAQVGGDTGYAVTAAGGSVGGETGSTGGNSTGVNYLIALPAA